MGSSARPRHGRINLRLWRTNHGDLDRHEVLTQDHEDFAALHDLVMAVGGHHPGILLVRFDNDLRHNLTEPGITDAAPEDALVLVKRSVDRREVPEYSRL